MVRGERSKSRPAKLNLVYRDSRNSTKRPPYTPILWIPQNLSLKAGSLFGKGTPQLGRKDREVRQPELRELVLKHAQSGTRDNRTVFSVKSVEEETREDKNTLGTTRNSNPFLSCARSQYLRHDSIVFPSVFQIKKPFSSSIRFLHLNDYHFHPLSTSYHFTFKVEKTYSIFSMFSKHCGAFERCG